MITALRSRAFQAKWNRATRRDRKRVERPAPRKHSPAEWAGSMAVAVLLLSYSVAVWVAAAVTLWGLR